MQVPRHIFREYDVRGIVGRDLTPELAELLGRAFATAAWEAVGGAPPHVVGRAQRTTGAALSAGFRAGVVATGAIAVDVGECPTPALYLAERTLEADAGCQVTGSHNPPEFNGFKMVVRGEAMHGEAILGLWERISLQQFREGAGREEADGTLLRRYREAIVERHTLARPVKVVVDCGNGVGSLVAVETLRQLGAEVIPIFCESDGTFPNHHPDPTVPENLVDLQAEVRRTGAELGIAFDGDADRIGAVDENGRIIFGDQLLVIFGRDAVRRFGTGVSVIFDVKCSEVLPQALAQAGAKPTMWKTGHSLVKAKMKELKAPLAGEMSGHIFFGGDYYGFDDALFGAARLLEAVAARPFGLAALIADLPTTFATPELRVETEEDRKFAITQAAVAHFSAKYPVNTIDGVRMTFPEGWGLIRASNTQPVLVLRFEATSEAALAAYRTEVMTWLAAQGVRA
jgi:phosphomannomutase/phosphoglucomutase